MKSVLITTLVFMGHYLTSQAQHKTLHDFCSEGHAETGWESQTGLCIEGAGRLLTRREMGLEAFFFPAEDSKKVLFLRYLDPVAGEDSLGIMEIDFDCYAVKEYFMTYHSVMVYCDQRDFIPSIKKVRPRKLSFTRPPKHVFRRSFY